MDNQDILEHRTKSYTCKHIITTGPEWMYAIQIKRKSNFKNMSKLSIYLLYCCGERESDKRTIFCRWKMHFHRRIKPFWLFFCTKRIGVCNGRAFLRKSIHLDCVLKYNVAYIYQHIWITVSNPNMVRLFAIYSICRFTHFVWHMNILYSMPLKSLIILDEHINALSMLGKHMDNDDYLIYYETMLVDWLN